MSSPSESLALDLIFPPEECVWQEDAESYVKYGHTGGVVPYDSGYVPDLSRYYAEYGIFG